MLEKLTSRDLDVAALEALYQHLGPQAGFAAEAISALRQLDAQVIWRAAWLLRRHAREHRFTPDQLIVLGEEAQRIEPWLARLNLCQLFARTGCPLEAKDAIAPFLQECARDRRALVRAWALSALFTLREDPELGAAIVRQLAAARRDPAKSVQARLRQLAIPSLPVR
ncbi:MAG: hypothetical protein U1F61_18650 [Opitutaceae bacterium]